MNREQEIESQIETLRAEREAIRSRRMWTCPCCHKRTAIAKLTFIQDHWYVSPSGCSGGDYWKQSNQVYIPCPKCNNIARVTENFVQVRTEHILTVIDEEMYDFVTDHKYHFGEILDYHRNHGEPTLDTVEYLREEKRRRN